MRQPIIAVTTMLAGAAVMALVVSLQQNPMLWTHHAKLEVPAVTTSTIPAPAKNPSPSSTPSDEASVGVVTLPEVRITSPSARAAARPAKEGQDELAPCSEWRDLGPTYVDQGNAHGMQRVRNLC
jgi:hypothetical protein